METQKPISPLRQRMTDDMRMQGRSIKFPVVAKR